MRIRFHKDNEQAKKIVLAYKSGFTAGEYRQHKNGTFTAFMMSPLTRVALEIDPAGLVTKV